MPGVLVVVAAGPGLGRAVALRFAAEGCAVGLLARSAGRLADLAAQVTAAGAPVVATAAADVADEAALRAGLTKLADRLGPTTVLVFNASAYVEGSATTLPATRLRLALDVGVVAALVAVQHCAPAMRHAGRGSILLTGSVAADRASTSAAAVGVAKAGLRSLARSLHQELAPDGVRVVSLTLDGVLRGPAALDVGQVAQRYWELHAGPDWPDPVQTFPP